MPGLPRLLTAALVLAMALSQIPATAFAQGAGPDASEGRINDSAREFGVWWVEDYNPAGPGGSDLPATRPDALGLRDKLVSTCKFYLFGCWSNWSTPPWTARFVWGNSNAWSTDWRRSQNGGSENSYIDSIDLAYFAGHGSANGIIFGANSPNPRTVTKNDALNAWGDRDLDWIGFAACNVLDNPLSNLQGWGQSMNGVRLIMGFQTVMNDVPHGVEFGRYIRDGYTMTQAWFKAADKLQSQGRVARVLAEQQAYFNDTHANHNSFTLVNWPKWYLTHPVGSEPARPVDIAQTNGQMPVLNVVPLSLAESQERVETLDSAFGVDMSQPDVEGDSETASIQRILQEGDVIYSADGQLEMDSDYGLFLHADKDNLWKLPEESETASGEAMMAISQEDARAIATSFLTQNNLMPKDAQFFEVLGTTLTQLQETTSAGGEVTIQAIDQGSLNHQVIFSRIISIPVTSEVNGASITQNVEFSVMGPGAKLKMYVADSVPASVAGEVGTAAFYQEAIEGGMGGYRQVADLSGADASAIQMVDVLPYEVIEKLFESSVLEKIVSLDHVPVAPSEVVEREIISDTLAYWEGPIGFNQGELIPVYALTIRNLMQGAGDEADYEVESTSYIPVNSTYMAPLAYISTTVNLDETVTPGDMLTFNALDASLPLTDLGLDPSPDDGFALDFALGTGEDGLYIYNWYLNEVNDANRLEAVAGSGGRTLEWTVPIVANFKEGTMAGNHRIILEVVDTENSSEPNTSVAEVSVGVEGLPPTFIPSLSTDE
ncbi:MAG: DUF6345 domain-containing protein [Litorilinea sp.]